MRDFLLCCGRFIDWEI